MNMDYSVVSQAAKRFEQKSEANNEIKENMQKVINALKEIWGERWGSGFTTSQNIKKNGFIIKPSIEI